MVTHIILPDAFKNCTIRPNHFAFSVTLALSKFSEILCLLELAASTSSDRVFVVDLTVAIRPSVLERADEFIAIHEGNAASMLKPSIDNAT